MTMEGSVTIRFLTDVTLRTYYELSLCPALAQGSIGGANSVLRMEVVKVTDKRVTFMSEVLAAIRLIKTYAWEDSFKQQVSGQHVWKQVPVE